MARGARPDWSADDREILVVPLADRDRNALVAHRRQDGFEERGSLPEREKSRPGATSPVNTPDGRFVYTLSNRGSEADALVALRCRGRHLEAGDRRGGSALESFSLSPDGKTLALVSDGPTASRLELRDATSLALRWAPKIPIGDAGRLPRNGVKAARKSRSRCLVALYIWRRVLGGGRTGAVDPVDEERDRQLQPGGAAGPGNRHVEKLRWPDDFRRAVPAARAIHRASSRHYQYPRGSRWIVVARTAPLPGPQRLFSQRARHRDLYPNVGSWGFGKAFGRLDDGAKA